METFRPYRGYICEHIDKFDAMEDYPFMYIYSLLDEWYPNSKFILTTRDPKKLAESDRNMWRNNGRNEKEIPTADKFIARYENHRKGVLGYFNDWPDEPL